MVYTRQNIFDGRTAKITELRNFKVNKFDISFIQILSAIARFYQVLFNTNSEPQNTDVTQNIENMSQKTTKM